MRWKLLVSPREQVARDRRLGPESVRLHHRGEIALGLGFADQPRQLERHEAVRWLGDPIGEQVRRGRGADLLGSRSPRPRDVAKAGSQAAEQGAAAWVDAVRASHEPTLTPPHPRGQEPSTRLQASLQEPAQSEEVRSGATQKPLAAQVPWAWQVQAQVQILR